MAVVTSAIERVPAKANRHRIRAVTAAAELWACSRAAPASTACSTFCSATRSKYSPEGDEITVSLREEQDRAQRQAVLTVRDQGVGIPAADQLHILERFHRGADQAPGWTTGAGIGLIVARFLVEQHHGAVTVASKHGAGTTVTVRLPVTGSG